MNKALCLSALLILGIAAGCGRTPENACPLDPPTPIGQATEPSDPLTGQSVAPSVRDWPVVAIREPPPQVGSPVTILVKTDDADPPAATAPEAAQTPPASEPDQAPPSAAARIDNDNFDLIEAMLSQYRPKHETKSDQE